MKVSDILRVKGGTLFTAKDEAERVTRQAMANADRIEREARERAAQIEREAREKAAPKEKETEEKCRRVIEAEKRDEAKREAAWKFIIEQEKAKSEQLRIINQELEQK